MSQITSIRIPADLKKKLEMRASLEHRSLSNQIEVSLQLAMAAIDHPDLPLQFIQDILEAKAERKLGLGRTFNV